ncbi:hypothetical protein PC9H_005016 [Pleurotus ostreatus]|uniref:Uncharacterized protein n=1 Tax=Pleurotus ostreatus TaxID=5322 RepID=A0A8H6ZW98_PLEOS|nr:uncharacterized protein PC9H_005016 [Pleurotus ostreatus]KAF7433070.1 hypothetical protein PC9H_005016 [Pleurotus ostreatus]
MIDDCRANPERLDFKLSELCDALEQFSSIFPELILAKAAEPASFLHKVERRAIFFSGLTDYGVLTLKWNSVMEQPLEKVDDMIAAKSLQNSTTLVDILKAERRLQNNVSRSIIIEAVVEAVAAYVSVSQLP